MPASDNQAPRTSALEVKPFLTNGAILRTGDDTIPGCYSDELQMWVVETAAGPAPIVSVDPRLTELVTKTKVLQEQDDEAISALLEGTTKTADYPKRDDVPPRLLWLEGTTKTETRQERDDHR